MEVLDFLYVKLNQIKEEMSLDCKINVYNEKEFINQLEQNEISVIVKRMISSLTFNTISTPYQIVVMSEQNDQELTLSILNKLAIDNNWSVISEGTSRIKLEISQPMLMNNFEVVGSGYRSTMFFNLTTFELKNVVDIENLKIDGESINAISANVGYGANMDLAQFPSGEIATSQKTSASLVLSIIIPCIDSNIVLNALNTSFGLVSGNNEYILEFDIGTIHISNLPLKISGVAFASAINDIPSINITFTR